MVNANVKSTSGFSHLEREIGHFSRAHDFSNQHHSLEALSFMIHSNVKINIWVLIFFFQDKIQ